ncbi:MAG: lipoate--protein ligase [Streptococcaceae bacterium]|jgi:lipoate-protein ligase A|nr:lipoate--protein ligase [Streptococcaceae bacterium]
MKYIVNKETRATYNIAMDEWLLTRLKPKEPVFALWQNESAIIVGKHQNTFEEVNDAFVKKKGIEVVRRVSGGGAVYHDLGNVNFTFIIPVDNPENVNWKTYVEPMRLALQKLGLEVELSGRNDIEIGGRKMSGNAQRFSKGYLMHHGTLMFNVDVETLVRSLNVQEEKFLSKAVKSVRSRVTNIREYLPELTVETFIEALTYELTGGGQDGEIQLTSEQLEEVSMLEKKKFSQKSWNYGENPPFNYHSREKFTAGSIEVNVYVKDGKIQTIQFQGDFLGVEDVDDLTPDLIGLEFSYDVLELFFKEHDPNRYFGVSVEELLQLFKVDGVGKESK